jgi:NitT/TauT family transport system substrate-binding protein
MDRNVTRTRITRRTLVGGLAAGAVAAPAIVRAQGRGEKAVYMTNWRAQAEHGGFYQALATGIYSRFGIDAEIRMGGPQINGQPLMMAGRIDFNMAGSFSGLNFAKEKLPFHTIASLFQKDPQVLISHAGVHDTMESMKGKPILIGAGSRTTFWPFLRKKYGFTDDQIRPYTFNMAPFLADRNAIQQGFLTSEPFAIERAGAKPKVFLLADLGYDNYQTTIEAPKKLTDERPDFVQKFVDATILGWYSYLYEDPTPGNLLIKKDNPDMDDDKIANSIKLMKEFGIVDGGDAKTLGIGAMTDERWQRFGQSMIEAGLYEANLDIKQAYTTRFVNKRVGLRA